MVDVDDSIAALDGSSETIWTTDLMFLKCSIMLFELSLQLVDGFSVRTEI